jgi:hypothetical protein
VLTDELEFGDYILLSIVLLQLLCS